MAAKTNAADAVQVFRRFSWNLAGVLASGGAGRKPKARPRPRRPAGGR